MKRRSRVRVPQAPSQSGARLALQEFRLFLFIVKIGAGLLPMIYLNIENFPLSVFQLFLQVLQVGVIQIPSS